MPARDLKAVSEPRVLVLAREPDIYRAPIRARYPGLALETCSSYEALGAVVRGFEPTVVLTGKIGAPFPRELLLDTAPSIEWVQCDSAGVDHLRPFSSQVRVTSASGIHDEALADYVVCAMLMFNLHFPTFFRQQRDHVWEPKPLRPSNGQKLVVLGLGGIGSRVGAKAKALGLQVIGVRARPQGEAVGVDRLVEVLEDADFLAVTLPRTKKTLGLVSESVLASMKPGSVLVNISRGGIVDERALARMLRYGPLRGAVLDVFETEPLPAESELWDLANVVITPHTGDIEGWQSKVVELFCANLERFRAGKPLENVVDPERGY